MFCRLHDCDDTVLRFLKVTREFAVKEFADQIDKKKKRKKGKALTSHS